MLGAMAGLCGVNMAVLAGLCIAGIGAVPTLRRYRTIAMGIIRGCFYVIYQLMGVNSP
jgi:hypothetical protein